ncbi:hypothetical protein H5410_032863 [Solanum commersonii]|uniref:Uncharacterized protein n=1 Tax=Solanum commersonii TaxID=4109 RepID=A0A9J5YNH2_SOLCO|nr:hypothetical protein H5410_032863 [Solanum commersonii]
MKILKYYKNIKVKNKIELLASNFNLYIRSRMALTLAVLGLIPNVFVSFQQIPNGAKDPYQLDKSQMPSIRLKYDEANFFVS